MTEREIRKELLAIAEDIVSYEFSELDDYDRKLLERGPIQKAFGMVQSVVNADEKGFYQEEYNERLEKIEKTLKDLWLIA